MLYDMGGVSGGAELGGAMAQQIGAMRARLGRMSPAQIYDAARLLHSEARARGLAVLEELAARMVLQMAPHGGRGAALAYLEVMAQAAELPEGDGTPQSAEAWLAVAALRLGH